MTTMAVVYEHVCFTPVVVSSRGRVASGHGIPPMVVVLVNGGGNGGNDISVDK